MVKRVHAIFSFRGLEQQTESSADFAMKLSKSQDPPTTLLAVASPFDDKASRRPTHARVFLGDTVVDGLEMESPRFCKTPAHSMLGRLARRIGAGARPGTPGRYAATRCDRYCNVCRRRLFCLRARTDDQAAVTEIRRDPRLNRRLHARSVSAIALTRGCSRPRVFRNPAHTKVHLQSSLMPRICREPED